MRFDHLPARPMLVLWIVCAVLALAGVLLTNEILFDSFRGFSPDDADVKNDWVVAAALVAGDNPYRDLSALSSLYAGGNYEPPAVAPRAPEPTRTPRTPGALLLAVPLLLVSFDQLVAHTNTISAILIVPILGLAIWPRRSPLFLGLSVAVLLSVPMLWSFRFSSVSAVVALLGVIAVVAMRGDNAPTAGVSIALAATLKLFPAVLLVVAASRRSLRTVIWAVSTFALLNLVPLAWGNIILSEVVDALWGAGERFAFLPSNISLTEVIAGAVGATPAIIFSGLAVGTMCVLVYRRPSRVSVDALLLMGVVTLLTPLSWPHYLLVIFPLGLLVALEEETSKATRATILMGFAITIPTLGIWASAAGGSLIALAAGFERFQHLAGVVNPPRRPRAAHASIR